MRIVSGLLVPITAASLWMSTALAQGYGPTGAAQLLAQAAVIDDRCQFLSTEQREELNRYAAKAEVAATYADGVKAATSAMDAGALKGQKISCGQQAKELVVAVMNASRHSLAGRGHIASSRQTQTRAGAPAYQEPAPEGELERYKWYATGYLVELQCRHLSNARARQFWKLMQRSHKREIVQFGREQVIAVKTSAEKEANSIIARGCGPPTAALVKNRYKSIKSNG